MTDAVRARRESFCRSLYDCNTSKGRVKIKKFPALWSAIIAIVATVAIVAIVAIDGLPRKVADPPVERGRLVYQIEDKAMYTARSEHAFVR